MRRLRRFVSQHRFVTAVTVVVGLLLLLWPVVPALTDDEAPNSDGVTPGPVNVETPQAPGAALNAPDVTAWLDGYLPARLEAAGIIGASVSVVNDGKAVTSRGYGFTDSSRGQVVDPTRTLFRAGSVTKLFTATAAMQLVQDGRLELDTDISRYLDFNLPRRFDKPITLRNLLTHTAGFEERVVPFIATRAQDLPTLRDVVANDPPEQIFAPGAVPAYSNYGMSLVGYLVQRASGQPYDEYVNSKVLTPLAMRNSTLTQPLPEEFSSRMSAGYRDNSRTAVPFELVAAAPAGSLTTTADDMTRFMLAHLQNGRLGNTQVLDEATTELMHTPALGQEQLGTLAGGELMTLGFFQEDRNGHRILGHGGDTNAFHSHLQIWPDDGAGIFITLNSTGTPAAVTQVLRDQLLNGFADRYLPGREAARTPLATSAEHSRQAEGSYLSSRRMQSTFLRSLNLLQTTVSAHPDGTVELSTLTAPDGSPRRWHEIEPWVFQEVGGEDRIAMRLDDGKVTTISYQGAFALTRTSAPAPLSIGVLIASVAILLLTILAWPTIALVRRHYRRPLTQSSTGRRARRTTRIGALLTVLSLTGWALIVPSLLSSSVNPPALMLRTLQVLTATGLVLLLLGAGWHLWSQLRSHTTWPARLWTVAVVTAAVGASWTAITYGLLTTSITY